MHIWFTRACVTANSPGATQSGYSVITIRVPNESAKVITTGLTVTLPTHKAGDATVRLPAAQTHRDGSVMKWEEPPKADGSEPDHPVPTLQLAAAGATADTHGVSASAASGPAPTTSTSDNTARWLGGAGLVLGLARGGAVTLCSRSRS